jgi:lysophospholipase L1-like esterase
MRRFPIHAALSILAAGGVLGGARLWNPAVQFHAIVDLAPPPPPIEAALRNPVILPGSSLLDDSSCVLDHFYAALWRTEKHEPGAVTRIVHYGDSPTTADLITGDIRVGLQSRYGNAGHGFLLIAKPWAWYQHTGADVSGSGWAMAPASRFEARDGMFGLGGVSFTASGSAHSRIVYGEPQDRFELWYLHQPAGGSLNLTADGQNLGHVETAADSKTPGFAEFTPDKPAKRLEIETASGNVRLFGVVAERNGPGVVYDSLGLNGASITVLSRMFGEAHLADELRHRNPQLVIVNYGTNEADFANFVDKQYEGELREALRRIRAALPDASILLMSPMDRGHKEGGDIETMPTIPKLVDTQRRVARETGCGFFDTFTAMGGEGTMARWYAAKPRLVSADFIHPTPAGGKIIADIFTREMAAGLNRFKLRAQLH